MAGGRVDGLRHAERINAAAELLASGMARVEAARLVAQRFSVSVRQGRRYVEAAAGGPVEVPQASVVFTVKVAASLVARVRQHAGEHELTISAVVTQALSEFLARAQPGQRSR